MAAEDFPNYYDDPRVYGEVRLGGILIDAPLVEIDGNEIEDEYNVQRPIGQSGAVAVFKGTKLVESVTLTFEGHDRAAFANLRDLWEMLKPAPGTGGGTGTKAKTEYTAAAKPKEDAGDGGVVAAVQNAVQSVQNAVSGKSDDGWPKNPSASPYPGPKPPTLKIENPLLAWIGVTAVSRKKWKGPYWRADVGSWRVDVTFIQAKPPTPANVGAQSPSKGSQFTGGAPNQAADNAAKAEAAGKVSPV